MNLTHNLSIHLFIPTKKPTTWILLQVVGYQLWAHLGSNQGPPDYECSLPDSIRLHTFVSVCTSLSYFTLNVKDYTGLDEFVEILAPKLASYFIINNQTITSRLNLQRPKNGKATQWCNNSYPLRSKMILFWNSFQYFIHL